MLQSASVDVLCHRSAGVHDPGYADQRLRWMPSTRFGPCRPIQGMIVTLASLRSDCGTACRELVDDFIGLRISQGALVRLERYEPKASRTVLWGGDGGNAVSLPDISSAATQSWCRLPDHGCARLWAASSQPSPQRGSALFPTSSLRQLRLWLARRVANRRSVRLLSCVGAYGDHLALGETGAVST